MHLYKIIALVPWLSNNPKKNDGFLAVFCLVHLVAETAGLLLIGHFLSSLVTKLNYYKQPQMYTA